MALALRPRFLSLFIDSDLKTKKTALRAVLIDKAVKLTKVYFAKAFDKTSASGAADAGL